MKTNDRDKLRMLILEFSNAQVAAALYAESKKYRRETPYTLEQIVDHKQRVWKEILEVLGYD